MQATKACYFSFHRKLAQLANRASVASPTASFISIASNASFHRKLEWYQPPKVLTCAPLLASCKAPCADRSELSAVDIIRLSCIGSAEPGNATNRPERLTMLNDTCSGTPAALQEGGTIQRIYLGA